MCGVLIPTRVVFGGAHEPGQSIDLLSTPLVQQANIVDAAVARHPWESVLLFPLRVARVSSL